MEILVITGCSLRYNFSAGLSHSAYIRGLLKNGNDVDLVCFSEKDIDADDSINPPYCRSQYEYYGVSLYEKLSKRKSTYKNDKTIVTAEEGKTSTSLKSKLFKFVKRNIRYLYGVYGPNIVWFKNAKKFRSQIEYDYVISMSDPPISHKVADYLLKHKRIKSQKWIQLWEDPWAEDLGIHENYNKNKKAEGKLLDSSQDIVYVSPITLLHQQEIFPNNKDKMRWCPLASYYKSEEIDYTSYTENYYGYFGDYSPSIRNIEPFYNVAVKRNLNVDICGSPFDLFPSKNNVKIFPRLPLGELKKHEDKTNIVICLFNLGGGQIPGKIYQLAATNKIILAILDGPEDEQKIIRDYFEKFNRFVFCQNNEKSISEAIDRIQNNDLGGVSNKPIDDFSVEKVAKMLLGD